MKAPQSFAEMSTKHLACRSFRHQWEPLYTSVETIERRRAYVTPIECLRCGATCTETYFITAGERHRSQPVYPALYLVADLNEAWGGRTTLNTNVRVELYGRLVDKGKP